MPFNPFKKNTPMRRMNLRQLRESTLEIRKLNSRFCVIDRTKIGKMKDGTRFVAAIIHSTKVQYSNGDFLVKGQDEPQSYVTVINFLDANANVKVACSCLDYLYRWEYANTQKGAADIEYCNGQAPVITNPSQRAGLCKHLTALMNHIAPMLDRAHA